MAAVSFAAAPTWLDLVAPIITPAEKKAYRALDPAERPKFEEAFWTDKAITAKEYSDRVAYIDAKFGSTKLGSGANTDQGRVYLALGPPNKITRFPSSRIFQPVEIWYYSIVPGVINTEVSLMFFQKNGTGFLKLYSPTTDTIRALLVPQASTVHMFGPNDGLNESDIRNTLKVSPAEDEIVSAAVNVAKRHPLRGQRRNHRQGLVAGLHARIASDNRGQVPVDRRSSEARYFPNPVGLRRIPSGSWA